MSEVLLTEVPSSLKQLARLVVRGFYSIEDSLIIDMLVRNPCMKEDDICDFLKFEKKMLRARIATLKSDKFLQVKLKMETGPDGKAQKVNYYYINYKTFVNVVKYKLDHMRKRMETEERDATSRASFKCPNCLRSFTDLEADQLFDISTSEFRCIICGAVVEEDQSAVPQKDSRLLLARFNEQLEPLYVLLREVEDVRLAPSVLEPEPTDLSTIHRPGEKRVPAPGQENWSGEASRKGLLMDDTRVDVTIGDDVAAPTVQQKKERPIWMVESTVIAPPTAEAEMVAAAASTSAPEVEVTDKSRTQEDIMSVLLAHESKAAADNKATKGLREDDSSDDETMIEEKPTAFKPTKEESMDDMLEVGVMESDDEEAAVMVKVGDQSVPLEEVNDEIIAKMTPQEKDAYIQLYQEYYSHMYD